MKEMVCRFGVEAPDGRRSSVWHVKTRGNHVYVEPRKKGGEFKISLHPEVWRIAFDKNYAQGMRTLGTWGGDRCVERMRRPPEHAQGFTRSIRMYFPESELRVFSKGWEGSKPIEKIPAPTQGEVRVVDFIFTTSRSRFSDAEWPLRWDLHSEKITGWTLPNGEILWLVHFVLSGWGSEKITSYTLPKSSKTLWLADSSLESVIQYFRANFPRAKKLDNRQPLSPADTSSRIMIPGSNEQLWFCVIDAAQAAPIPRRTRNSERQAFTDG